MTQPLNPLSYEGTIALPYITRTYDPPTAGSANPNSQFNVPTIWVNTATGAAWILTMNPIGAALWVPLGSDETGAILKINTIDPDGTQNFTINGSTNIAITPGSNAIAVSITGVIPVPNGGTGAGTLTGVLIGNGTSAITAQAPLSVAYGGTGAATLTGVLIGNGTGAVTGNAITQYDVLVGGAANAITSVSPNTATYVLTSNGPVANPTFQAPATGITSINVKKITTTGAYTPTAGTSLIYVEVLGGGGGGTGGTGVFVQSGAGGGAGEYAADFFSPSSQTVTIGTAGVGGFDNSLNATAGGTTSFGAIITAVGGAGATVAYVTASPYICNAGALGGTGGTGGSANAIRYQGESGSGTISSTGFPGYPGTGGSSVYGAGAQFVWATGTAVNGTTAINGYGAGGSGGLATSSSSSTGGNGSPGICIVTEFIG